MLRPPPCAVPDAAKRAYYHRGWVGVKIIARLPRGHQRRGTVSAPKPIARAAQLAMSELSSPCCAALEMGVRDYELPAAGCGAALKVASRSRGLMRSGRCGHGMHPAHVLRVLQARLGAKVARSPKVARTALARLRTLRVLRSTCVEQLRWPGRARSTYGVTGVRCPWPWKPRPGALRPPSSHAPLLAAEYAHRLPGSSRLCRCRSQIWKHTAPTMSAECELHAFDLKRKKIQSSPAQHITMISVFSSRASTTLKSTQSSKNPRQRMPDTFGQFQILVSRSPPRQHGR